MVYMLCFSGMMSHIVQGLVTKNDQSVNDLLPVIHSQVILNQWNWNCPV